MDLVFVPVLETVQGVVLILVVYTDILFNIYTNSSIVYVGFSPLTHLLLEILATLAWDCILSYVHTHVLFCWLLITEENDEKLSVANGLSSVKNERKWYMYCPVDYFRCCHLIFFKFLKKSWCHITYLSFIFIIFGMSWYN